MTSGRWSGGGGLLFWGMSSFTAWVMMGSETIRVTSNTNITSINGVVLMSHITPPPALPTCIAIVIVSWRASTGAAAEAVVGFRQEAHLDDAAALNRVQHTSHRLELRVLVGADVYFRLRLDDRGRLDVRKQIVLVGHPLVVPVDVAILIDRHRDVLRLGLGRDVDRLRQFHLDGLVDHGDGDQEDDEQNHQDRQVDHGKKKQEEKKQNQQDDHEQRQEKEEQHQLFFAGLAYLHCH